MSTRSTLIIKGDKGEVILQLYRHWDGYFKYAGKEIVEFIQNGKLVIGYNNEDEFGKVFNGMGDLACQLIAHFKRPKPDYINRETLVQSVGNFHIEEIGSMMECYQYELGRKGDQIYLLGKGDEEDQAFPNFVQLFPLTPKSRKWLGIKDKKKSKKKA
jgi:hypothetical protein